MNEIRLLREDEIEVRVGAIYEKGITLLLYKNARVDMTILDSCYGPMNWQRHHFMAGEAMLCEVSIKDKTTGEWITKTDLGTPSFSEPLKGAASDSFKRACTNWGIGRELYTAPFIWIPIQKVEMKEGDRGKKLVKDSFAVQTIRYNEEKRTITGLVIRNQKNQVVFQYLEIHKDVPVTINNEQTAELLEELKRTGISLSSVLRKHKLNKLSDMSIELWESAMEALNQTPERAA